MQIAVVCIVTNGALLAVVLVVGPLAVPAGDALPQPRDVVPGLEVVRRHRRVPEDPVQAPVRSLGPPLLFGRSTLMFVELFYMILAFKFNSIDNGETECTLHRQK